MTEKVGSSFHFLIDQKRADKLRRVGIGRGKSVIQMFRDWIDGLKEVK